MEAFNARFRQECLNEHWFLSVADAQERVKLWRQDYNRVRPHSSLENMTPEEFVQQALGAHPHGRWARHQRDGRNDPTTQAGSLPHRLNTLTAGGTNTGVRPPAKLSKPPIVHLISI